MSAATFQYKPRDPSQWDKRSNQSASSYIHYIKDEFNQFKAHDGDNAIRIIPPTWDSATHYGYDIWVHYNVGPDGGTVLCLSKMQHKNCPICEFQAKAEAQGREDADDYKPKRRVLVWIVDMKPEKAEDNPAIWSMPWTVDRDISKICKDRETGELYNIDNPVAGYNVYFDKAGEKQLTKYTVTQLAKRASSLEQVHLEFAIANPVPTSLLWRDYNEVKLLFEGNTPEVAAQGASTTAAPTPAPAAPAPAAPAAPETTQVPMALAQPQQPAPTMAQVPVFPPPPPPPQFQPQWVSSNCGTCGNQQFTVPEGLNCVQGHLQRTPPPQPTPPPTMPPPPTPISGPQPVTAREPFQTGAPAGVNTLTDRAAQLRANLANRK